MDASRLIAVIPGDGIGSSLEQNRYTEFTRLPFDNVTTP